MDTPDVVIIDNGSYSIKAGLSEWVDGRVIPCIVGHPYSTDKSLVSETFVGNKAQAQRDILNINFPIDRGIITNWEDMEKIWHHVYQEISVNPTQHPVLLSEPPFNPKANREKTAQVLFESFGVPAMHVELEAVLSLYSKGYLYGTVINVGHGVTHVMTFEDGQGFTKGVKRLDLAGNAVTQHLSTLLSSQGYSFPSWLVNDIKEKCAYVAASSSSSTSSSSSSSSSSSASSSSSSMYELPDGQQLDIGKASYECTEILFQPSLIGLHNEGLHKLVYNSVMNSPIDYRSTLIHYMYMSGGGSILQGLVDRLKKELLALVPKGNRSSLMAHDCIRSVFYGATVFAGSTAFQDRCITKAEYEEYGSFIINYNKI